MDRLFNFGRIMITYALIQLSVLMTFPLNDLGIIWKLKMCTLMFIKITWPD